MKTSLALNLVRLQFIQTCLLSLRDRRKSPFPFLCQGLKVTVFSLLLAMVGGNVFGQVNITPIRTDVTGFSSWTDANLTGSTYLQLLTASSQTISPAMNFDNYSNESLNFTARTFGGTTAIEIILTVWISIDNGTNWTNLGTRTPGSTTLTSQTPFDISSYNGTQVKLKFTVGGNNASIGVGIDDISITGSIIASSPPSLTAASSPTVDANFNVTFTDNTAWRNAITAVKYGTNTLTVSTDYAITAGTLTLKPSGSASSGLRTPGTATVTVVATGYSDATVSQAIGAGVANKLAMSVQPTAPASNGAVLATQPKVLIQDQYGNTTTSTASVTATVGAGTWTIGGTTSVAAVSGLTTFSGLTATSAAAVSGATVTFASGALTNVSSSAFNISAPAPSNDLCSNATTLAVDGNAIAGTLLSATNSTNTFTNASTKKDVWYKITPSCTGSHNVSVTFTTGPDLDIYVFSSSTCPTSGTENFVSAGSNATSEIGTFSFVSGTTYYIRVIDFGTSAGAFNISVTPPTQTFQAVTTNAANSITALAASINGNLTAVSNCPPSTQKGFVYALTSANTNPQVGGTGVTQTSVSGITTGAYVLSLGSLTPGTNYSYNTYVYDGTTYAYGTTASFSTLSNPNLTVSGTTSHGSVCPNSSASSITYTINNSGADATNVVVSSSDPQFVVSNLSSTTILANGSATYNVVFTPTTPGAQTATITIYYNTSTQASTSSLSGTGTAAVTGVVATNAASSIVNTTATLNGSITTLGVCPSTSEKGFVYSATSTNADPIANGTGVTKTAVSGLSTGSFTLALTGLIPVTSYTVKSYIYNGSSYIYGSTQTFSTLSVATKLGFGTAPSSTAYLNTNMSSFTVRALRTDDTVDPEYSGTVTLTSTGTITGLTSTLVNGIATFSTTQFTTNTGIYTLTASLSSLTSVTSSSISVTNAPVVIYQHDFGTTAITTKPYTVSPGTFATNLSNSSWTVSGAFIDAGGSTGKSLAVSSTSSGPFTLTLNVATGFQLSINSFSLWTNSSSTGAISSIIVNGTTISSGSISGNGTNTGTVSVSNSVNGLTGTITIVLNLSGSGSFRVDDFTLTGVVSCSTPAQPSTITGSATVCANSSQTYSVTNVTGVGYTWSLPSNVTGSSTSNSIATSIGSAGNGTITVTPYNSASGCSSYTGTARSLAVTVNSKPTVTATANQTVCSGTPVTLSGSGASTYSWTGGINDGVEFTPSSNTTYTVTGTDANNCTNTATSTVTIASNNTASTASSTQTVLTNTALTAITHTTTGATSISGAGQSGANTLPAGVSASWANDLITISGTPTSVGTFTYSIPLTGGCGSVFATGTITVVDSYTWTGAVSSAWSNASNWIPNGVPTAAHNVNIPAVSSPNNQIEDLSSLTINSNVTFTVKSNAKLTLSGNIINNGTFIIENGGTLLQGLNSQISGNGTFRALQNVTGISTGNNRSYYLGSPLNSTSSSVFSPVTNNNLLYNWNANTANPNWYQITSNSASIDLGVGYLTRFAQPTTLTFEGTGLNNVYFNNAPTGSSIQVPCYRQATGSYIGYNLISNPFPSYLDWNDVYSANSTNFMSTIWYRIANGSNAMVFDTYNASGGAGTNTSGLGAASRYIAPMQAYWVRIPAGGPSTANLSFSNSMREHYVEGVVGLRSSIQEFPAFLRMNLIQGNNLDQIILYMKPDASSAFDTYDSEKMFLAGTPQLYSKVLGKSLVINGMRNNKKKTSVPLSLDLPATGLYFFQAEEYNIEDGLIILEDKQENVFQDLTLNNAYSFYQSSGTVNDRFVIHFHLPDASITAQGPSNIEFVDNDVHVEEASIEIASNGNGKVSVSLGIKEKPEGKVQVLDASGRIIFESMLSDAETMFDLQTSAGIYYVKVSTATSEELKKIVVQP